MSARTPAERSLVEKARILVEERRKHWHNADPRGIAGRALNVFSQMNSNNFHLIFELIQNADGQYKLTITHANLIIADVTYPGNSIPTLKIDLSFENKLVFEGNQIPFTEKNFNALCDAGLSSKKGDAETTGEKGLGFKSVFKVCDAVFIRSAGLSFSLSREGLGMVQPTWVEDTDFPIPVEKLMFQWTYIVLVLSNNSIFKPHMKAKLLKDIRSMSAQTVLFLRKLAVIRILDRNGWQRQVIKETSAPDNPTMKELRVVLSPGSASESKEIKSFFVVHEYNIGKMPVEEKRCNQATTVVQFAFPCEQTKGHWSPRTDSQSSLKIFAFLPLCESPFKFSINADWVTATNREDFLHDNDWNSRILDELPKLFRRSIKTFINSHPQDLRFSCLRWIPGSNAPKGAKTTDRHVECAAGMFRPVAWDIVSLLQDSKCVVATDLTIVKPPECLALRSEFSFKGRPILSLPNQIFAHKSYTEEDFAHLRTLGCMAFGKQNFLDSSEHLSDDDLLARFREHGTAWFVSLYKALASQSRWTDRQLTRFRMLSLVPSTDVASNSKNVLKRPMDESLFLPSNIPELQQTFAELDPDIFLVNLNTSIGSAEVEKFLIEKLQIKDATIENISRFLTSIHQRAATSDVVRSCPQIIKHMTFWNRFRAEVDFTNCVCPNMSINTTTGRLKPLKRTLHDPFGVLESIFCGWADVFFLNKDLASNQRLLQFLFECGLSVLPSLGSAPLLYLTSKQETALSFLELLRKYNQEDPTHIGDTLPDGPRIVERYLEDKTFVTRMSNLKCLCKDGTYRRLQDTLFESRALQNEIDSALFLKLDSRHEKSYRKILKRFGVRFDLDLQHRLKVLESLSDEGCTDLTTIVQAYKALEKELRKPQTPDAEIKKAFEAKPLLFRPTDNTWIKLDRNVYWAISSNLNLSTEDIATEFLLNRHYDELKGLFHVKLDIVNFELRDTKKLIEPRVSAAGTNTNISESFRGLLHNLFERYSRWLVLNTGHEDTWLLEILSLPVFLSHGRLLKNDGFLFFPDEFEIGKKLADKGVQVLELAESDIPIWRTIVLFINEKCPDTPIRSVSNMVVRDQVAVGERLYDERQSSTLRDHVPDIVRYIFHRGGRLAAEDTIERLSACSIYTVDSVFETIYLEVEGMPRVELDAVPVSCMIEKTSATTRILLSSDNLDLSRSIENQILLLTDLKKYLGQENDFREFLVLIWQKSRAAIDHYMKVRSISAIPIDLAESVTNMLLADQRQVNELVAISEQQETIVLTEIQQASSAECNHQGKLSATLEEQIQSTAEVELTGSDTISNHESEEQDEIGSRNEPLFRPADDCESDEDTANGNGRHNIPRVEDEDNNDDSFAAQGLQCADETSDADRESVEGQQTHLVGLMNPDQEMRQDDHAEPEEEDMASTMDADRHHANETNLLVNRDGDKSEGEEVGPGYDSLVSNDMSEALDGQETMEDLRRGRCVSRYSTPELEDRPAKRQKFANDDASENIFDRLRNTRYTVEQGLLCLESNTDLIEAAVYAELYGCFENIRDLSGLVEQDIQTAYPGE